VRHWALLVAYTILQVARKVNKTHFYDAARAKGVETTGKDWRAQKGFFFTG
jgi:hypothetical protein